MTRQLGQASYITFVKGLNTEAGPLTFPENCTIEDVNCVLTLKGSHKRRYGIKQEIEGKPLSFEGLISYDNFKNWSFNTYTWKAPGNVGSKTFLVIQVVDKLLFYDISNNEALPLVTTSLEVNLSSIIVDKEKFQETGCSFSSGKGYLFVCGRGLDPCYISYDKNTNTVQLEKLSLQVRDSYGVDDSLENNTQPTELSDAHKYNLINQGWLYQGLSSTTGLDVKATIWHKFPAYDIYRPTTNTSMLITLYLNGSIIWTGPFYSSQGYFQNIFNTLNPIQRHYITVQSVEVVGYGYQYVFKADAGSEEELNGSTIYIVASIQSTTVSNTGVFTYTSATSQSLTPYTDYFATIGKYPSNAQQWFVGRQEGQQINVNEVSNFDFGNKRAPRGRCIINPFTEDRTQYVPNIPVGDEDTTRIIDTAFMGGRVFYLRQNSILYSQVIEDIKQAGMCYTEGDPTSEDSFDVVDTDGGVITITDMGDAIALFELPNGLAVFAKNGVWLVTGVASDESFKATGYSVRKLSNLECVSKNSIVNVKGVPIFWATSGIYAITQRDYMGYDIQSLSDQTIQSKYVEIPKHNLKNVVGIYNNGAQKIAWFYDVTEETSLAEKERKTKALLYDVRLQAFYELEMDKENTHPFICGAFNTPYLSFVSLEDEVYDNNDNLVYDNDENIIYTQEAIKNTDLTDVKYLAFDTVTYTPGYQLIFNNVVYARDTEKDSSLGRFNYYAWTDPIEEKTIYTIDVQEPRTSIEVDSIRYYREPSLDVGGKYCWVDLVTNSELYTDSETPEAGDTTYTKTVSPIRWKYNNVWYERDEQEDIPEGQLYPYICPYAWKNGSAIIYTQFLEPTDNFKRTDDSNSYFRTPALDRFAGYDYYGYRNYSQNLYIVHTRSNPVVVGAHLVHFNTFGDSSPAGLVDTIGDPYQVDVIEKVPGGGRNYGGLTTEYDAGGIVTFTPYAYTVGTFYLEGELPVYENKGEALFVLIGISSFIAEGFDEDTKVILLTSCNFDDTNFKDWGNVEYVSTFTTGANTCGDSFITKDIVYLTTQLSRTEALNLQNNIGNESSCLMQMKWDFEDNEYSHKWTTPVQIYRSRRIFAPGLDTPGFDDIAIRMPVITTKHKVRGNGKALQIKFSSEEGKNFEVLGWNLIVGARS